MKTLILTDNTFAAQLAHELNAQYGDIDIKQSPNGPLGDDIERVHVRQQVDELIDDYDVIFSIHCKQLFPQKLVEQVRCINVHPGYNPYNRGWYPQVFSILNGMPSGITIHEMDAQLDHGPIIMQRRYDIEPHDTSGSAYEKIMALEREMVLEHFPTLRDGDYESFQPEEEGNLNYKKDFNALRKLDLEEEGTFGDFLKRLRALTHGEFKNAYFEDDNGEKIYVRVYLERD